MAILDFAMPTQLPETWGFICFDPCLVPIRARSDSFHGIRIRQFQISIKSECYSLIYHSPLEKCDVCWLDQFMGFNFQTTGHIFLKKQDGNFLPKRKQFILGWNLVGSAYTPTVDLYQKTTSRYIKDVDEPYPYLKFL